jgi:hypothetical protein
MNCPNCGAINGDSATNCARCGRQLHPGEDPGEDPYLVWDEWPFAWPMRITQTRRQFQTEIALAIVVLAVIGVMFIGLMFVAEDGAWQICFGLGYMLVVVFTVAIAWVRYRLGRRKAIDEARGRRETE